MKKFLLVFCACTLLMGCNRAAKYAAYDFESYLEQADGCFDNAYSNVRRARQCGSWDSYDSYLRKADSDIYDAKQYVEKARQLASSYESTAANYCSKALSSANDAQSTIRLARQNASDSYAEYYTDKCWDQIDSAQDYLEDAERYVWY